MFFLKLVSGWYSLRRIGETRMTVFTFPSRVLAALAPVLFLAGTGTAHAAVEDWEQVLLDNAAKACGGESRKDSLSEFSTFFDAFVMSPAVRAKYSAPTISLTRYAGGHEVSNEVLPRAAYDARFPVVQEDVYYKPRTPARAGDDAEFLEISIDQSSTNDFIVEWSRVHYDGNGEGGDDLGNRLDASGKIIPHDVKLSAEGRLLFQPAAQCWKLISDVRIVRPVR